MSGGNPAVDFNEFENYPMHILIPPNIETGKQEIKMIANKYQYKDKFIIYNTLFCFEMKPNQCYN